MTILKSREEIERMAEGGRLLAAILGRLRQEVKPGGTTRSLDALAAELIREAGAEPAFLNYRPRGSKSPYPATICVSVNETIVHGLPSEYVIRGGDVVKIDLGIKYKGFCVDSAITVGAGEISGSARRLIAAIKEALAAGINAARAGSTVGDIGAAIENVVKRRGFSVAEQLTGHGIGRDLHEDPVVPNTGKPNEGEKLEPGMVLAIEPMVAAGGGRVKELPDGSFVTADGSVSAHFEHTVAIRKQGILVLTEIHA